MVDYDDATTIKMPPQHAAGHHPRPCTFKWPSADYEGFSECKSEALIKSVAVEGWGRMYSMNLQQDIYIYVALEQGTSAMSLSLKCGTKVSPSAVYSKLSAPSLCAKGQRDGLCWGDIMDNPGACENCQRFQSHVSSTFSLEDIVELELNVLSICLVLVRCSIYTIHVCTLQMP